MEQDNKQLITEILKSFKIGIESIAEYKGATLTLYEIKPEMGVKISKIRNLKDEIAVGLAVPSVRIIAPMDNGKIGIEVPNKEKKVVPIAEMFNSWFFQNTGAELPLAIGKTITGEAFVSDLAEMPHLLVAGATGQGKSVCLNTLIMSLLQKKSPDELKLVLIDPKQVELSLYANLENSYLACPVITETSEAERTLNSICTLMDERYELLSSAGVRNIQEYNNKLALSGSPTEKLPYVVVVIDEYGDLILTSDTKLERTICRIAQKARAVGIHMIIATQRPDTKIVTGNIKANFPTRIAFRTTTGIDSRVVLDQMGAEKLSGKGDMILFNGNGTTRMQCAYATIGDVTALCESLADKYDDCPEFSLPLTSEEKEELHRQEIMEKYREEERKKQQASIDAEKRMEEWRKEREATKEEREKNKKWLFQQLYGHPDKIHLFVPKGSKPHDGSK